MTALFILLLIIAPLLAIFAILTSKEILNFSMFVGAIIILILSFWTIIYTYPQFPKGITIYISSFQWLSETHTPVNVIGFMLDPLSAIMLIVVTLMGFFVIIFSIEYMSERNVEHPTTKGNSRYYFWLMMFVGSMIGITLSPNFLMLLWFWEMTSLCSWQLISHYREERKSIYAGFKALLITHFGGLFFIVATVIIFVKTGSFDFSALKLLDPQTHWLVTFFLLIAAWSKAAEFPFFTWLPDAMQAPTPISAYLHAAAMVKAGVYLAARITLVSQSIQTSMGIITISIAMVTIIVGLIFFFYQNDLKRLLAFSTITHLGYIFLGLGLCMLGTNAGLKGAILHIPCHAVGKTLLFLCVGRIAMLLGTKNINDISGLFKKMPITSFAFVIGLFSIMGVPPFSCFFSKIILFAGAVELGGWLGYCILIPFALEAIVALFWFLKVGQNIFFGEPSEIVNKLYDPVNRPFFGRFISRFVFISLVIISVIIPWIMFKFIDQLGF
jgi:hydrogenase-4 component D